jgi:hypothetical protein
MNSQTAEDGILLVTAILCLLLAVVAFASVLYLAVSIAAQSAGALPGKLG